ncbi:MAG: hypothetical protein RQ753_01320, partial [Desulfurivibrionaceae bacterium]|nr:hypothetical protein [Desulfurivibrionaceae bacterium]
VDIPLVLSTSLPPCICAVLERSRIQGVRLMRSPKIVIPGADLTGPGNPLTMSLLKDFSTFCEFII